MNNQTKIAALLMHVSDGLLDARISGETYKFTIPDEIDLDVTYDVADEDRKHEAFIQAGAILKKFEVNPIS